MQISTIFLFVWSVWNLGGAEASIQPTEAISTTIPAVETSSVYVFSTADLNGVSINDSEALVLTSSHHYSELSLSTLSSVATTFLNDSFTSANVSIQSTKNVRYSSDGSVSTTLSDFKLSASSVMPSITSSTGQTTPSTALHLTSANVSDEGYMTTSLSANSVKDSLKTVSSYALPMTDQFSTETDIFNTLSLITSETAYLTVTNKTVDSSFFTASDVLASSRITDVLTSSSSSFAEYMPTNTVPTSSFIGEVTATESFQPDPSLFNASTTFTPHTTVTVEVLNTSSGPRMEETTKATLTEIESSPIFTDSTSSVSVSSTSETFSSSTIVPIPSNDTTRIHSPSTSASAYLNPSFTSVHDEAKQSVLLISTPMSTTSLHLYEIVSSSDLLSTTDGPDNLHTSSRLSIDSLTSTNIDTQTSDRLLSTENFSVDVLQNETSSLEFPASASVSPTQHSSDIVLPSYIVTSDSLKTYRIILTFEGSCGRLEYSEQLKIEFLKSLIDVIDDYLPELSEDDFELDQIECHPFKVVLLLKNIRDEASLNNLISSVRNNALEVPIIDRIIVNYHAIGIQLMPVNNETTDNMENTRTGLEISDIVVIVISALLFAFLIFLCAIVVCRECYKRKRAASFNLLDVPHVNLKLDDFTLTKIPRPKMTYFDSTANPIVTNGKHRQGKTKESHMCGDGKRVSVNSENIHVRMRDHSDGIVIGVTCSPALNDAHSSKSASSSQSSPGMDQSAKVLLKDDSSEKGATNPNCNVDDEEDFSKECNIKEDDNEEFL